MDGEDIYDAADVENDGEDIYDEGDSAEPAKEKKLSSPVSPVGGMSKVKALQAALLQKNLQVQSVKPMNGSANNNTGGKPPVSQKPQKPMYIGPKPVKGVSIYPGDASEGSKPGPPKTPKKPAKVNSDSSVNAVPNGIANKVPLKPPANLNEITNRKNSLNKTALKPRDLPEPPSDPIETVTDTNGKKFKKLTFVKPKNAPKKPESVNSVTLPAVTVQGQDVVLRAGSTARSKQESSIQSMAEDEEIDLCGAPASPGKVLPPSLPNRPNPAARGPPPAVPKEGEYDEGAPAADGEAEYDDAEAGAAAPPPVVYEDEDIYEEFEEDMSGSTPASSTKAVNSVSTTASQSPKPDPKAEKEKEKEKKKQEKLEKEREKARLKEMKENEKLAKKHKLSEDELFAQESVKVIKTCAGGKNNMLKIQEKEWVFLIKRNAEKGKHLCKTKDGTMGYVAVTDTEDSQSDKSSAKPAKRPPSDDGEGLYDDIENAA